LIPGAFVSFGFTEPMKSAAYAVYVVFGKHPAHGQFELKQSKSDRNQEVASADKRGRRDGK
jgi:hypothetical protein